MEYKVRGPMSVPTRVFGERFEGPYFEIGMAMDGAIPMNLG
jgi:hypothetical protein